MKARKPEHVTCWSRLRLKATRMQEMSSWTVEGQEYHPSGQRKPVSPPRVMTPRMSPPVLSPDALLRLGLECPSM